MPENTQNKVNALKKISFHYWMLLGIIVVAAVLRLWKFGEMQFMHDEISAILRSTAGSLSEVIYKQATTDVHPIGIPVFLHYWVMLVGSGELMVRLPFIVCGLLSIYFSFKIAEKWFNPTVGLMTALFLATLQCPTMYGQLARPYATGMLFSAMMCWCWTLFFFGEEKKQNRAMIGFIISAALCCYDHYFCLLFAIIVCATGFFFINKENWKKYLVSCVVILLLFVPHLRILMIHLSVGNGGEDSWLGKPQPDWLITFLKYLFHYSSITGMVVLAAVGTGFYIRTPGIKAGNKFRLIALVWFLLGPVMAYFFSILKTPVLQFSSFTFALPFLFIFLFSFYGEMKNGLMIAAGAFIIIANVYSLFKERKHYPLFYQQPYGQMAQISSKTIAEQGKKNVAVALNVLPGFVDFYFGKKVEKFDYLRVDLADMKGFIDYLNDQQGEYFIAGNLTQDQHELIREKYPYLVNKAEGFTYSVFTFSKKKPAVEIPESRIFYEKTDLGRPSYRWSRPAKVVNDSAGARVIMEPTEEYGMTYTVQLSDVITSRHNILVVSATLSSPDSAADPVLVLDIHDSKGPISWRGTDYINYNSHPNTSRTIYVAELLSGFDFRKHPYGETKIYVWNRGKQRVNVEGLSVKLIQSNPFVYGLYEDF
ncbi:MAG: glycosyltransferase family 39 protein [Bacteroidia bacterium]